MAWTFDAPAGLRDFADLRNWHNEMVAVADDIIATLVADVLNRQPTQQDIEQWRARLSYVHPTRETVPADAETIAINAWGGFPRLVERRAPWNLPPAPGDADGSLRAVDHLGEEDYRAGRFEDANGNALSLPARDRQDEYLEWASEVDSGGNLTKITFVAEGYDYFARLFETDPQTVVDLYKDFTRDNTITRDALTATREIRRVTAGGRSVVTRAGDFNPRNRFNVKPGAIVHLSHRANSLGAEVNLAGVSALARRKADGSLVDGVDEQELICCNQGGEPNRNSDPKIAQQAYDLVRKGFRYTLANPIGLYIAGVNEAGLTFADGTQVPRDWWHEVRGSGLWGGASRVLRLELRPPPGETRKLSDLRAGGSRLRYAGQVARLMSVHLFVTRWKHAQPDSAPVVDCLGTCCQKIGSELLIGSDGGCPDGFALKFPGLITQRPLAPVAEARPLESLAPTADTAPRRLMRTR